MKSFSGAYVNLLKTSIGSGVLNFPFLFKTYGIILAVGLTLLTGIFAAVGLVLLSICANHVGRSSNLSYLSHLTLPHTTFFVNLAVFIKCFGVSTSYIIIVRQLLPSFLETITKTHSVLADKHICLLFFIAAILPLTLLKKMDSLKYSSFIGIISICFVAFASVIRYFFQSNNNTSIYFIQSFSGEWFSGFGKFVFSFTCHQNIFAVNAEMDDNSVPRLKKLIYYVASSAFLLYMVFGFTNYCLYGDGVLDNVLVNYPHDHLATIVRGLYVIVMGVSYPLQMAPARLYLFNLINPKYKPSKFIHCFVTTILVAITYFIAITGTQLGLVYSIVGATASTFICLILPALFYFNLDVQKTRLLTIMAYCAFLFGVIVFTSSLTGIYLNYSKY